MNCEIAGGVNDCYWNIDGRCTSFDITRSDRDRTSTRDWDSNQNCTLTQLGVHVCGSYLSEGVV